MSTSRALKPTLLTPEAKAKIAAKIAERLLNLNQLFAEMTRGDELNARALSNALASHDTNTENTEHDHTHTSTGSAAAA